MEDVGRGKLERLLRISAGMTRVDCSTYEQAAAEVPNEKASLKPGEMILSSAYWRF